MKLFFYAKFFITLPKFVKDKFIFFAYYSTLPSAPVLDIFYDPAKSTK